MPFVVPNVYDYDCQLVFSFNVLSRFLRLTVSEMATKMYVVLWMFPAILLLQKGGLSLADSMEATMCPKSFSSWVNLEGKLCYSLETEKMSRWEMALENCKGLGGSLASFHSRGEIDRVRQLYSSRGHEDSPYIGLHRGSDGNMKWSDGTTVDFLNWSRGSTLSNVNSCTTMGYYTGNWYAVQCNASASYLCSTPKRIPCEPNTCKNGGYCTKDGINELFPCTCKHGYQGLRCSEKIKCGSGPCKHGGICTHNGVEGVFNCTCKHGYGGLTCEQKIVCDEQVCKNGGSCSHDGVNGVFRCNCARGFKGVTCEERDPSHSMLIVLVCLGAALVIVIPIVLFFLIRRYRRQKAPDPKQLQSDYKKKDTDSLESCHMNILDEDEDEPR